MKVFSFPTSVLQLRSFPVCVSVLLWGRRALISRSILSFTGMSEHIGHLCAFLTSQNCFAGMRSEKLQGTNGGSRVKLHKPMNHCKEVVWVISRKQLYLLWYQYIFLYTHSNKNAVLVAQWVVYKYDFFLCRHTVFPLDCLSKFGLSLWKTKKRLLMSLCSQINLHMNKYKKTLLCNPLTSEQSFRTHKTSKVTDVQILYSTRVCTWNVKNE